MSDSVNIVSRPWGNLPSYTDAEWHQMWSTLFDGSGNRGVCHDPDTADLEVIENNPVGMSIQVGTGVVFVGGLWGQNVTTRTLTVSPNGGGANRYDLVFLHWNRVNQDLRIRIVDGTAATCGTAVPPAANAIGTYQVGGPPVTEWAIPLACITVVPGAVQITNVNIVDMREFSRFRTCAGDTADGVTITTQALTTADTGEVLTVATGGVGIGEINTAIAGDGLTGGGGSALSVVPGTGLEVVGDQLRIATVAAGNGLSGGGGAALAVNVDGTTIAIAADTLSVGANALDASDLPDRIRRVYIGANKMRITVAGGATWGTLAGMPSQAEGWLFSPGVNEYVIGRVHTPADFYLSSPSAGYFYFVWAHILAAGGPFTVWWHVIYNRMLTSSPYTKYVLCGHTLTGGTAMQAWAKATNEVTIATANLRKITKSAEQLTGLSPGAVNYLDFEIGRNGGNPADNYAGDVLLLGMYYDYLADM